MITERQTSRRRACCSVCPSHSGIAGQLVPRQVAHLPLRLLRKRVVAEDIVLAVLASGLDRCMRSASISTEIMAVARRFQLADDSAVLLSFLKQWARRLERS